MIWNSKVISPISWIVIKKLSEVWQVIWWWMPILIVADETKLQIKIWVSDSIVNNIKAWTSVKIELEWNTKQIEATVTNIYPSKDSVTKKNVVEISITSPQPSPWGEGVAQVKIWTMAKVYFEKKDTIKDDSIIISNQAILQKFMLPWVYVLKNWKAIFKNIEIIEQNDTFSKVEWLKAWEIIITEWKENIYDGEKLIIK